MAETATLSLAHVVHAVISTINADERKISPLHTSLVDHRQSKTVWINSTLSFPNPPSSQRWISSTEIVVRVHRGRLPVSCLACSVLRYTTSWGRLFYEVLGSTSTYAVFPWLQGRAAPPSSYCSCPTFADAVLFTESQLMVRPVEVAGNTVC